MKKLFVIIFIVGLIACGSTDSREVTIDMSGDTTILKDAVDSTVLVEDDTIAQEATKVEEILEKRKNEPFLE